ncbi:SDR family oxidoreductase [Pedobacter sp. UC225_65]|uniref:SDR family oxidoreductase n=1 Tax=Pedobacter sp. UC225_65 TaxID=3350173 RepID=UPI00366B14DB
MKNQIMENQKVWFITGASKGLGLALVKQLLNKGHQVAATSRNATDLNKVIPANPNFLALTVDINNEEEVKMAINKSMEQFGHLDVVVNNAGYGLLGSLEELSEEEARKNFNINVFGSLNVIRNVMPHLRAQQSGHIFNISSIGGFTGNFPGWGIYCATKFAVHGLSESLAMEVKPFGVNVTIVSPGYFRTNFLTKDSMNTPKKQLDAYQSVRDSQTAHQDQINGNQAGGSRKSGCGHYRDCRG